MCCFGQMETAAGHALIGRGKGEGTGGFERLCLHLVVCHAYTVAALLRHRDWALASVVPLCVVLNAVLHVCALRVVTPLSLSLSFISPPSSLSLVTPFS